MNRLQELLDTLSEINKNPQSVSYVKDFEDVLARIWELGNPDCIPELVKFFDDNAEFYEMMFSIIHLIETFEDTSYVKGIIKSLPDFWNQSPEWASTIHIRILNSEHIRNLYLNEIRDIEFEKKNVLIKLLESINEENEKFIEKTTPLLNILNQ